MANGELRCLVRINYDAWHAVGSFGCDKFCRMPHLRLFGVLCTKLQFLWLLLRTIYPYHAYLWLLSKWFSARLSATAQQSYCRHVGVRPSVKPVFSETIKRINAKFWDKLPVHHIAKLFFFCFQNFKLWSFLRFFFVFVNIGPYGRKNFKRHLLWKYTLDSLPKNHAYS